MSEVQHQSVNCLGTHTNAATVRRLCAVVYNQWPGRGAVNIELQASWSSSLVGTWRAHTRRRDKISLQPGTV